MGNLFLSCEKDENCFRSYKATANIGNGAFAVVKEVVCKKNEEHYALKLVKCSSLSSYDRELLFQEVSILKLMKHPQILRFHDFFEHRGFFCIVTELMPGGDLYDRLNKRGHYSKKSARALIRNLLRAIHYMHSLNVVHRDLKPENVLLCSDVSDSDIKIADFGLAEIVNEDLGLHARAGTMHFLAPEIMRGEKYGKGIDIWGCGVIMHIVLSGNHPFPESPRTQLQAQLRQCANVLKFNAQEWEQVSPEAKHLVAQMLTTDASKRITAKQALDHSWIQAKEDALAQAKIDQILHDLQDICVKYTSVKKYTYNIDKLLSENVAPNI